MVVSEWWFSAVANGCGWIVVYNCCHRWSAMVADGCVQWLCAMKMGDWCWSSTNNVCNKTQIICQPKSNRASNVNGAKLETQNDHETETSFGSLVHFPRGIVFWLFYFLTMVENQLIGKITTATDRATGVRRHIYSSKSHDLHERHPLSSWDANGCPREVPLPPVHFGRFGSITAVTVTDDAKSENADTWTYIHSPGSTKTSPKSSSIMGI